MDSAAMKEIVHVKVSKPVIELMKFGRLLSTYDLSSEQLYGDTMYGWLN